MSPVNHAFVKSRNPRPPVTGAPVMIRCQPEFLATIDQFRRSQPDLPNRQEAMRRLIEWGLRALAARETAQPKKR